MLRLLRKVGIQHSLESKTFWIFTISEFILVVLGILIALQIENWNQNRQERKLETVLLNELLLNLKSDHQDLEFNANRLSTVLNSSEIILIHLEENSLYNDSLEYHFGQLSAGTIYNRNLSAFESIKSIGIDIISNNSLRQQITYLYSVKYDVILTVEKLHHQVVIERLYPICGEYLRTFEYPMNAVPRAVPLDFAELSESNVFKEAIKQSIVYLILQIQAYQHARDLISVLIEGIEKELALR